MFKKLFTWNIQLMYIQIKINNMKKILILFFIFISYTAIAQMSDDEVLRKKILIDYIDQVYFEYSSPEGEAIANIIIKAFRENLVIIDADIKNLSEADALKITSLKLVFQNLLNAKTPSWGEIFELEKERLILIDKQLRRKSKYENSTENK